MAFFSNIKRPSDLEEIDGFLGHVNRLVEDLQTSHDYKFHEMQEEMKQIENAYVKLERLKKIMQENADQQAEAMTHLKTNCISYQAENIQLKKKVEEVTKMYNTEKQNNSIIVESLKTSLEQKEQLVETLQRKLKEQIEHSQRLSEDKRREKENKAPMTPSLRTLEESLIGVIMFCPRFFV